MYDSPVRPRRNSIGGSIHQNYDLLLQHKLWIIGGNLPAQDHDALRALGFKGIFPSSSKLDDIVNYIRTNAT